MEVIQGIPVSPGVVIGTVFVVDDARRRIPRRTVPLGLLERDRLFRSDVSPGGLTGQVLVLPPPLRGQLAGLRAVLRGFSTWVASATIETLTML